MNILSFDIEEWFIENSFHGGRIERYGLYERKLNEILDLLDEHNIKATFFIVGMMANDFPEIVKKVDIRGHEVGCHSNRHMWLSKMNRDEAYNDTRQAIDSLEQCIGKKIVAYRAPAFSIRRDNLWAFEVLAECGIEFDSSVFPAQRDFGGFPGFPRSEDQLPTMIKTKSGLLKEFPIITTRLLNKDLAFSGGGYFRFFPLGFVKNQMGKRIYNICYFHIGDFIQSNSGIMSRADYESYFKENGPIVKRLKRYVKSNLGKSHSFAKMKNLLDMFEFISIGQASNLIDWSICPTTEFKD